MTDKPPRGGLPATASQSPSSASPVEREADPSALFAQAEEPDLFDALWDPDMDTRPKRIRRTRARREARFRDGGPPRGKRRDAV
jgi:hypothetical protein